MFTNEEAEIVASLAVEYNFTKRERVTLARAAWLIRREAFAGRIQDCEDASDYCKCLLDWEQANPQPENAR